MLAKAHVSSHPWGVRRSQCTFLWLGTFWQAHPPARLGKLIPFPPLPVPARNQGNSGELCEPWQRVARLRPVAQLQSGRHPARPQLQQPFAMFCCLCCRDVSAQYGVRALQEMAGSPSSLPTIPACFLTVLILEDLMGFPPCKIGGDGKGRRPRRRNTRVHPTLTTGGRASRRAVRQRGAQQPLQAVRSRRGCSGAPADLGSRGRMLPWTAPTWR